MGRPSLRTPGAVHSAGVSSNYRHSAGALREGNARDGCGRAAPRVDCGGKRKLDTAFRDAPCKGISAQIWPSDAGPRRDTAARLAMQRGCDEEILSKKKVKHFWRRWRARCPNSLVLLSFASWGLWHDCRPLHLATPLGGIRKVRNASRRSRAPSGGELLLPGGLRKARTPSRKSRAIASCKLVLPMRSESAQSFPKVPGTPLETAPK
jgi:hypothetical protein